MTIHVPIILLSIFLSGCHHDNSDNDKSVLLGNWITEACEQSVNSDGGLINQWAQGIYLFQSNGDIEMSFRSFSDSSCSGEYEPIQRTVVTNFSLTFIDNGKVTLEEGIEGGSISVTFDFEEQNMVTEGFYTINSELLCFSDNLNFDPNGISTSEAEYSSIDFEKCMSKVRQP